MKKLLVLTFVILIMFSYLVADAESSVNVYSNYVTIGDKKIELNSEAFIYQSEKECTYIPIEDIIPVLGGGLGWDTDRNAEICIYNGKTFYIYSEKNEIEYNGEILWSDGPSIIKDGRFYICDDALEIMTGLYITNADELREYGVFEVVSESTTAYLNGSQITLEGMPYSYLSKIHIPLDSALKACGCSLGWDDGKNAVICYNDGIYSYIYMNEGKIVVGDKEYLFDYAPIYIKKIAYISDDVFRYVTGFDTVAHGDVRKYAARDTMENTIRQDAYRLASNSVYRGGGVVVVDGFGMELVSASVSDAQKYAGVINAVAESVPNVNVYNILVPTAAEFYAPIGMYPNQLAGIRTVYQNLSDKVTPVNVYDTLSERGNEKIYFSTDHHWTQRGAYYAYKEFIELKGGSIEDLTAFTNVPSYNFVGSFAGFAKGTTAGNIMKGSPELLERFIPKYATIGTVFSDCAVTQPQYTVQAVNTANNSYSCFVGGDAPVTVFYTDAPSDESILIIKESFGNAFATWAMNNYKKVCIVDPRRFNGFGGNYNSFNLKAFCDKMAINDVVFINYPVVISSSGIRSAILSMK